MISRAWQTGWKQGEIASLLVGVFLNLGERGLLFSSASRTNTKVINSRLDLQCRRRGVSYISLLSNGGRSCFLESAGLQNTLALMQSKCKEGGQTIANALSGHFLSSISNQQVTWKQISAFRRIETTC